MLGYPVGIKEKAMVCFKMTILFRLIVPNQTGSPRSNKHTANFIVWLQQTVSPQEGVSLIATNEDVLNLLLGIDRVPVLCETHVLSKVTL